MLKRPAGPAATSSVYAKVPDGLSHLAPARLDLVRPGSYTAAAGARRLGQGAAAVDAQRVERRLAAILAADMVGYSRLMEADEAGTLAQLKAGLPA